MELSRLFRILYSTLFTLLTIVLLGLILITPADAINQSIGNKQITYAWVIGGAYLLTSVVAILIYILRLRTNRQVLLEIPKTYIPVEKGDVGRNVRKMVVEGLSRSAIIAWEARPRVSSYSPAKGVVEKQEDNGSGVDLSEKKANPIPKLFRRKPKTKEKGEEPLSIPLHHPVWGEISHDGWASPYSSDLPNLQYISVIQELPHLIEAKAVSLAPPDPDSTASPPTPDLRVVELIQRPAAMGLREYCDHLTSLGVLSPSTNLALFLAAYENARFSTKPLSEIQFRELMRLFAETLRDMTQFSPALERSIEEDESDIDGDVSSTTTPDTPRSRSFVSSQGPPSRSGSSEGSIRTAPSRRIPTDQSLARHTTFGTAPTTPSKNKERFVERSPSIQSFSQTRRPYVSSQASSNSLRSQSSVIRLSPSQSRSDLPYTLHLPRATP